MSRLLFLTFFICVAFSPLGEAKRVKQLLPFLPIVDEIQLGMSIREFKNVNKNASRIFGSNHKSSPKENKIFGEEVGKGEIGLITKETVYYYFVQGRLARIAWKDETGALDLEDARKIKGLLDEAFKLSKRDRKSFLGDGIGVFDATQEVYRSVDRVELSFVASEPFFSMIVTDAGLLVSLGKQGVFDKVSDAAIKKWDDENEKTTILEHELDYLIAIFEGEALEKAIRILKKNNTLPEGIEPVVVTEAEFIRVYWPVALSESGVPIPGPSKHAEIGFDKKSLNAVYVLGAH